MLASTRKQVVNASAGLMLRVSFYHPSVDFLLQVFPMETGNGGADSDSVEGLLHLASGRFPAHLLHLPAGVQLCPHLQQHVAACTPHLLLLRLRRPQPLQPGCVEPLWGPSGVPEQQLWSLWDGGRYHSFSLWRCRFSHQLLGLHFPRQVGERLVPSVVPHPRRAQHGRLHQHVLLLQVEQSHPLFCSFLFASGIIFGAICKHSFHTLSLLNWANCS